MWDKKTAENPFSLDQLGHQRYKLGVGGAALRLGKDAATQKGN